MSNRLAFLRIPFVGLLISLVVVALFIVQLPLLKQLDLKVYDIYLKWQAKGEPDSRVVIVDLDDTSLQKLGQWPWPRYQLARLLLALQEGGATAIGLDILFSEADRTSPQMIKDHLNRDMGVTIAFEGLPDALEDNDVLFSQVLAETPVVLGSKFLFFAEESLPEKLPPAVGIVEVTPPGALPAKEHMMTAKSMLLPLPQFVAVAPVGAIDVAPDMDGIVRNVPLVSRVGDKVYPNLALRTFMVALNAKTLSLVSGPYGLESLRIRKTNIPVSPQGVFHIPYRGPGRTFPYYSAVDVLEGTLPPDAFAGKIVFVGTSAVGLMDIRSMPFDAVYPGVEVHASTVDAILSERSLLVPPWTPAVQAFAIVLMGILSSLLFGFTKPAIYLVIGVGLVAGTVWGAEALMVGGMYLSPLYVIIVIVLEAVLLIFQRLWQSDRQKKIIQGAFGLYVAPEIVEKIVGSNQNFFVGEKRDVTIIFTDVRSFTTISEGLEPEQVVALLNSYFTPMTRLIRNSGGTLDKFIGDALMAFWNAPVDVENHQARAVETAFAIQENLLILNDELYERFGVRLAMGIGLHTGPVFVGNMGSSDLLDYTIIGDTVNAASRVEGLCSPYGEKIVVSDDVRLKALDAAVYVPIDNIIVKGKSRPIAVFAPLRPAEAEERKGEIAMFTQAREKFLANEFGIALPLFESLVQQFSEKKLYQMYVDRCKKALAQ